MTRKDFEMLAGSVEKLAKTNRDAAYDMACDLANACEKDNPRFDRDRFFDACGLGGLYLRPLPVGYGLADKRCDCPANETCNVCVPDGESFPGDQCSDGGVPFHRAR